MEQIGAFFESGVAPTALLIIRIIVPLLAGYTAFRCYTSFKSWTAWLGLSWRGCSLLVLDFAESGDIQGGLPLL